MFQKEALGRIGIQEGSLLRDSIHTNRESLQHLFYRENMKNDPPQKQEYVHYHEVPSEKL